jgi:hypothetical protein
MTLEQMGEKIRACAEQMNSRYGEIVFDEWAIVSLAENKARVISYHGPRNDDFLKNFARDLGTLRAQLLGEKYGAGDFEFSRHGIGTGIEAFLALDDGLYLICNNTHASMDALTKNPRWLDAQIPFADLAEKVRSSPLYVFSDETKFFKKMALPV